MAARTIGLTLFGVLGLSGCAGGSPPGNEQEPESATTHNELAGVVTQDPSARTGFISAVGQLYRLEGTERSKACTGTLIAPDVVLTAAHCIADGPNRFELPQAGGFVTQTLLTSVAGTQTTGGDCKAASRSHDLGLVWLATPVPPDIAEPQPFFDGGSMFDAAVRGDLGTVNIQAGVGTGAWELTDCGQPLGETSPVRSYAPIQAVVHWGSDPDDGLWEGIDCHAFRAEYNGYTNPVTLPGDSGGPIFTQYKGVWTITAVHSGHNCFHGVFANSLEAVASTIQLNYAWLVEHLGGDQDQDGVLDDLDNCPPLRCARLGLPIEACSNADQADDDRDGIGEVCDNCPAVKCAGGTPKFDCNNPDQLDWDQDGDGDQCDLCPDESTRTEDSDGDGVGDTCDGCENSVEQFPSCTEQCVSGRCIGGSSPHCSQLPDQDDDGLPDRCDACPTIPSYDSRNSNKWAEVRQNVTAIPDICDEIPEVRVSQIHRDTFDSPTVILHAEPIVGGDLPAAFGRARLGFCSCYDAQLGRELSEDECFAQGFDCSALVLPTNTDVWKKVSLGNAGQITQTSTGMTNIMAFQRIGTKSPQEMHWNWRSDVDAGQIDGIDCPGDTCRVYGAFMMDADVNHSLSDRDVGPIRDTHKVIRAPFLGESPANDAPEWLNPCEPSGCAWYRPDLELIRPPEWLARPGVVLVDQGGEASILTQDGPYLATLESSPSLVQALAQAGQRWVSAAESPRQVASLKPAIPGLEAVRIPSDLGTRFQGLSLQRSGGEVGLGSFGGLGGEQGLARQTLASVSAFALAPAPRMKPGYVLSATLGQLFVVGGEGTMEGMSPGDVWRYDLVRGGWAKIKSSYHAPRNILSSTFDASTQQLVVLSVDDNDTVLGRPRAQVHTIDTRTGESKMVLFWPYLGLYEKHAVSALDDGSLVLVASKGRKTSLWRFSAHPSHYVLTGTATLHGTTLDRPVVVDDGLLFALADEHASIRVVTVAGNDFKPGRACGGL